MKNETTSIPARLEAAPHPRRRKAARKILHLATSGKPASRDAREVVIRDASLTGLLLESAAAMAVGETVDIDMPEAGMTRTTVAWSSGRLYGCRFDAPISEAALAAAQLRSDPAFTQAPNDDPGAPRFETFGSRLRRLRKQSRLTLKDMGERLGVSKPTVWAWENDKARPLDSRLADIARILGTDESALTGAGLGHEPAGLLGRVREEIASAFGTEPDKIRILIEI